jgi:hypothetical protein
MRPETYVDLIRVAQLLRAPGGLFEQRPKVCRFFRIQICDVKAVAARLDEERADPERPDAVLDDPVLGLMDAPSRERRAAVAEQARLTRAGLVEAGLVRAGLVRG